MSGRTSQATGSTKTQAGKLTVRVCLCSLSVYVEVLKIAHTVAAHVTLQHGRGAERQAERRAAVDEGLRCLAAPLRAHHALHPLQR